ncbi:MAG: DUF503 domain-containing protein [candidate division WOR-3 bacterium]
MTVGLLVVDCLLGAGHSLKEKRRVLLSLTQKLHNQFNISIAEVAHQDLWQRSQLAMVCVNTEWQAVERIFNKIVNVLVSDPRFTLLNSEFHKLY